MHHNNKRIVILFGVSVFGLISCNAGSEAQNPTAPQIIQQPTSDGPINASYFNNALLSTSANSGALSTTWAEAGVIANLNPYAAVAYKTANIFIGAFANPKPVASTNQIYGEELAISDQINTLQAQFTNDQNVVYNWYLDQLKSNLNSAASNYKSQITNVNTLYNQYLHGVLFANPSANPPTVDSLESVPTAGVDYYYNNLFGSTINNANFQTLMTNLSNSSCANALPATNWQNVANGSSKISGSMAMTLSSTNVSSNLVSLLKDLQAELVSNINQPGQAGKNIIPLISQYNQTLEYIYFNTLLTLNQMYVMEASGNYFQWNNGNSDTNFAHAGKMPIQDCPMSTYNGAEPNNPNFTSSQAFLTQLYADRINSLYKTITHYIISDVPIVTLTALQQGYEGILNGTTPAKTLYNPANEQSIVGGWQANGLLYQESTLLAYNDCIDAMRTNTRLNSNNCPSLVPNMNNGYYDSESIFAYVVSNGQYNLVGQPNPITSVPSQPATVPFNFGSYCNTESGSSASLTNSATTSPDLVCKNWSGPLMANANTVNANVSYPVPLGTVAPLYQPWYITVNDCELKFSGENVDGTSDNPIHEIKYTSSCFPKNEALEEPMNNSAQNYWYDMAHNYKNSYTYYVASSSLGSNNFTLLAASTQNGGTPSFNYGNGEFYTSGSGTSFELMDGGFNPNDAYTHSALLQVTLPNGYNLPFYVFSYITGGNTHETFSSPLCPNIFMGSNPPGISACSQQSSGNGGFKVTTADGNSYYLNVLQPSSGQGMQYGYLQIAYSAQ